MKAVVCTGYGPPEVLQLREVAKPVPRDDEVLVKIRASAVTASDIFIRGGGSQLPWRSKIPMRVMIGLTKPRKAVIGLVRYSKHLTEAHLGRGVTSQRISRHAACGN